MPPEIIEILDNAPPYDPGLFNYDEFKLEKRGVVNVGNKNLYIGQWSAKNERYGYGRMLWSDGNYYEGHWKKDVFHGQGRYIFKNGDYYEGDWADG
jgi:hypothetical protein